LGYVQADAAHLPFRSHMFACATAIRFLGHIPPATRVDMLRELARVSQGYIIVDYCVFNPIINIRRQLDYRIRGKKLGFDKDWTWQSIPKRQLEGEFQAANLKAVQWFAKMPFFSDAWMVLLATKDMELRPAVPD
ncbi:MAG: hypothetical protein JXR84_07090, partial [Anaerolineae bacterium]|nr:hypothetical protein [Anaerolineae bacterium]